MNIVRERKGMRNGEGGMGRRGDGGASTYPLPRYKYKKQLLKCELIIT